MFDLIAWMRTMTLGCPVAITEHHGASLIGIPSTDGWSLLDRDSMQPGSYDQLAPCLRGGGFDSLGNLAAQVGCAQHHLLAIQALITLITNSLLRSITFWSFVASLGAAQVVQSALGGAAEEQSHVVLVHVMNEAPSCYGRVLFLINKSTFGSSSALFLLFFLYSFETNLSPSNHTILFPSRVMDNSYPVIGDGEEPYAKDFGSSDNYVRRWKWSVNVILIGTSQSGKSTLINRFRTVAVGPHPFPEPSKVGDGTFSCTKDPFLYEFDIPMTDFVLVGADKTSMVDVPDDEGGIFDSGFWKRRDLQVRRRERNADIVRLRLLDTPGLDDDKPELNAKNIEKVLQYLNTAANSDDLDLRSVSAVMFVVKDQGPLTDSLQKWYHHYQRCMPNLFGSIAVINTNFKVRDWKVEYGKRALKALTFGGVKLSTRDTKMKLRREAWADVFHSDPTHFFIDSKPGQKNAFEDFTSVNTIYDILLYLRSQGKLPIENIRLVKLTQMAAVDLQMVGLLFRIRSLWEQERDLILKSLSVSHQSLSRHKKNKLMWEDKVNELEKKIALWDSDVQWDLNTYSPTAVISGPSKAWKFVTLRGHENTFEITEKVFPFYVDAPDTDDTTWLTRKAATQQDMTWKGKYKSKWRKTPKFTARSYTTNRVHHADEIHKAQQELDALVANIADTMTIISRETALLEEHGCEVEPSPRLTQLTEWIAHTEECVRVLQQEEVPLGEGFSKAAITRYGKSIEKVYYGDVLDFVSEADPEIRPAYGLAVAYLTKQR